MIGVNPPTVPRLRARRAAEQLRPLITEHLDPVGLADRCATLATREHDAPDPLEVLDVVLRAVTPDPLGDLLRHFRGDDPVITGTVLRLGRTLPGDGVAHLVSAGALADAAAPVAVVASTANWGTVVCAWAPPTLVVCAERPVRRGFRYHLPGGLAEAAGSDNHRPPTSAERAAWYRDDLVPPEALEVLDECGVTENGNGTL